MKKSAALPFPVDLATFQKLQAAGRVGPVRIEGWSSASDAAVGFYSLPDKPGTALAPHRVHLEGWDLKQFDGIVRWAHDWPVGSINAAPRIATVDRVVELGPVEFLSREVSEPAWAVGELYRSGFLSRCSLAMLPFQWSEAEGGVDFVGQQLLDVSAVPFFLHPIAEAQARGIPLGWLKEWLDKVLSEAETSEEARLRLVCHPDQLRELGSALSAPMVQVPEGDDVLVQRVDLLISAVDRLTAAVQANTASKTGLTLSTDSLTATKPPAIGVEIVSRG